MKKTVAKFGGYGLACAFLLFLGGLYFGMGLDYSTQEIIGYLTILISLSFVFIGIKHYRDRVNGGSISFGRALLTGVLIATVTAVGIGIADYVYTTWVNPDFFSEYEAMTKTGEAEGDRPEYSSAFLALIMFLTVLLIGAVIALIAALVLKKK